MCQPGEHRPSRTRRPQGMLRRVRPRRAELPGRLPPLGPSARQFMTDLGRSSWPGALLGRRSPAPVAPTRSMRRKARSGATSLPASRSVRALRNWSSSNGFPGMNAPSLRAREESENATVRGTNLRAHVTYPLRATMGNVPGVGKPVSTMMKMIMTPGTTLHGGIP